MVLPNEMDALAIDPLMDYCTLITCTPYGINSHRMLVRGHRVETEVVKAPVRITSDASVIDPLTVSAVIFAPLLLLWMIGLLFATRKR